MPAVFGHEAGLAICAALRLDPAHIRSITLHFETGEVSKVHVTRFLQSAETDELTEVLQRYELHCVDEPLEEVTDTG